MSYMQKYSKKRFGNLENAEFKKLKNFKRGKVLTETILGIIFFEKIQIDAKINKIITE